MLSASPAVSTGPMAVSDTIRSLLADQQTNGMVMVQGETIIANRVLASIYDRAHYEPLWRDDASADQLVAAIQDCQRDGLRPEDYHLAVLSQRTPITTPHVVAARDLLLTDALIRLAFHMYYGKVDPRSLHPRWRLPPAIEHEEAASLLIRQIEAAGIHRFIDGLRPDHPYYQRLCQALSAYRAMAAAGGWDEIPDGPLIEKGDSDPRVPMIRSRLRRSGDLSAASAGTGDRMDAALEDAVARFQDRHRIDLFAPGVTDRYGAVGESTRERMNIRADQLIDRIRINMERARWVMHRLPPNFVLADIADFSVSLVEGGRTIWRTSAQVGDAYRQTPVFQSAIQYMEINPTWTIPAGILDDAVLPQIKKDPFGDPLRQFQVFDRSGRRVDHPETIPWHLYSGKTLPYRLVQPPGPSNPVGRIKFIFPNPDFVFMHDTPNKAFFDLERRDLSAGCVRVQRPFELARHLMRLDGQQDDARIETLLASGKTSRIYFDHPMPVLLFYGTVSVDSRGRVTFREDVYERDPSLLRALNAPVRLWDIRSTN